jgi:hypothetical protein
VRGFVYLFYLFADEERNLQAKNAVTLGFFFGSSGRLAGGCGFEEADKKDFMAVHWHRKIYSKRMSLREAYENLRVSPKT